MNYRKALVVLVAGCFLLLSASFQVASAAEQTVKFVVPGCVWAKTAARVSSILKDVDGVTSVETDFRNHTAVVTFDNAKTTVEALAQALNEGGYPIKGKPELLE